MCTYKFKKLRNQCVLVQLYKIKILFTKIISKYNNRMAEKY